jgi:hypothetical protein
MSFLIIGKSSDPTAPLLKKLIEVAGGTVLSNTTAEPACDFLVMGTNTVINAAIRVLTIPIMILLYAM